MFNTLKCPFSPCRRSAIWHLAAHEVISTMPVIHHWFPRLSGRGVCPFCASTDLHGCAVQLIFHLQTCDPPVLPPLHELFQDSCSAISSRPIHMGKDIDWQKLAVRLPQIILVNSPIEPEFRQDRQSVL